MSFATFMLISALIFLAIIFLYVIIFNPQNRTEDKIERMLSPKFNRSYKYVSPHGDAVIFDIINKKIALYNQYGFTIFDYADLQEVSVQTNNAVTHSTKTGSLAARAVIGALVAGPAGAVIGGVTADRQEVSKVKSIMVQIVTKNTARSHNEIIFFRIDGPGELSHAATNYIQGQALDCYGRLKIIVLQNSRWTNNIGV